MPTTQISSSMKLALGVFIRAALVSLGGALVGNGLLTEDQAQSLTGASDTFVGIGLIVVSVLQSLWSKWRARKAAIAVLCLLSTALMLSSGCVARKVNAPLGYEGSDGAVTTIGNYSQWTLGFLAKEAYEDKGVSASFTDGYASNGQTASSDSTASVEMMKAILPPLIQAIAAKSGVPIAPAVVADPAPEPEVCEDADVALPVADESAASGSAALAAKMAEAKAAGKPLVVLAGNVGCSYCKRLDAIIDKTPGITASSDIVFYRETSAWSSNAAAKWTGGGAFPVLRVTQWDAAGNISCDHKVNRPQSLADIEAALLSCAAK